MDGVDDDCNGAPDDGCPCELDAARSCYTGPASTQGIGSCSAGNQLCVAGFWSVDCSGQVLPGAETCDGEDNDCNGVTDEGCACIDGETQSCYGGPNGTEGVGPCQGGERTCSGGSWPGGCSGDVTPDSEACNGVDDDCDGSTDEGNPEGGGSCDTGLIGPCANGQWECAGGDLSCVSTTPTSHPDCQPCSQCLGSYANCDQACQQVNGSPGGYCAVPDSTDFGNCCGCDAPYNCSGCLGGQPNCDSACQNVGQSGGYCGWDGSTNPGQCCVCF